MVITTNASVEVHKLALWSQRDFVLSHTVSVFIEPASEEIAAIYDDAPGGQLYRIYADDMSIAIGDKLKNADGEYFVRGVKKFQSFIGNHSEIIARLWLQ